MITVRIPKEIREYKEKLIWGFTVRQLLCTVLGLGICVPLYIFGRKYLPEDVISWMVIIIILPFAGMGFITRNGMPFEKYLLTMFKFYFLFPTKTMYKTDNYFRAMQEQYDREQKKGISRTVIKNYKRESSLERAFLLMEGNSKGMAYDEIMAQDILSVHCPYNIPEIENNRKKDDDSKMNISKAAETVKLVEARRKENPYYVPTKKEQKMLARYSDEVNKQRIAEIKKGKANMEKANNELKKRKKAKTAIPKSTQDDLPYLTDYEEGVFEVEEGKYSKAYLLQDINYMTAREEEVVSIFQNWSKFINSFSEDVTISLVIDNSVIPKNEEGKNTFFVLAGDDFDVHRDELNRVINQMVTRGNDNIERNKYIVVTISADTPIEAIMQFRSLDVQVLTNLKRVGSNAKVMTTTERLALLHDKMRKGHEGEFHIDFEFLKEQGLSSKDYIAPSCFVWEDNDKFIIRNSKDTYYRCMYITNLPTSMSDEFLFDLTDCDFPMITNLQIQPIAQDKAIRMVRKQLTGMEANIIEAGKKAIRSGYSPDIINHDLKNSAQEAEELLDDMVNKNQKGFFVSIMVMISGESVKELEDNTKVVTNKVRKYTCQLETFNYQQREAFRCIMPAGIPTSNKLFIDRTLTTESTAIFIPFSSQELFQKGGFFYGLNQMTRNVVMCNRTGMKTPSGFVLGSSGSGKSFACKQEMLCVLLQDRKTGLLIVDPENEYSDFGRVFGATILNLSSTSDTYMNPMDMDENYGLDEEDDVETTSMAKKKEKAIQKKSEYLMSIIQIMMSDDNNNSMVTPQQKTIIDRAIVNTYKEYLDHDFDESYIPTFSNLQEQFDKEAELSEDGKLIADATAYYTRGTMSLFNHKTNLDFTNRFVVFNIKNLGKELTKLGSLIVIDFIWNRMAKNAQNKIRTYCFVDEIHVLLAIEYAAIYLKQLYKRGRKYGLVITGITQDVEEILKSDTARLMIQNADFIMMLNQKNENLKQLSEMLEISETQQQYVSMADAGTGLIFAENTIVPFINQFPRDSYLYELMSTNFNEANAKDLEKIQKLINKKQEEYQNKHTQYANVG